MTKVWLWLEEHALSILLLLGTAFTAAWLWKMHDRLSIKKPVMLLPIALLHTAAGVLSVKVFAFLESGDIGNMSLFGGIFFMPLLYFFGARLMQWKRENVFDVFTICMILTLLCARINCRISGCCGGLPIVGTQFRFPTRELEIIYYGIMLAVLIPKVQKREHPGGIYPIYMTTYGAFRFVVEFFRESSSARLFHLAHFWAAMCCLIGLSIYGAQLKKQRNKGEK